ncbi:MAG: hypothetical protein ACLQU1_40755 [Bryobacteraceae bacterium]
MRRLDSLEPELLRGSQDRLDAPFWSADSKVVVFRTPRGLIRIRVPDGAPELITRFQGFARGGTWSDSGTILISHLNRLYTVPASGGDLKLADVPGMKAGTYRYPQFLPESDDFLFLFEPDEGEGADVCLATLHNGKAINPVLLMKNETAASYTPAGGGRILFVRNDNLYSQKLDRKGRRLEGDAELVQQGVASVPGLDVNRAFFSVSLSGVMAWRPGRAALNQVTILDRQGKEVSTAGSGGPIQSLALSPDETRLLASGDDSWLLDPGQSGRQSLGRGWSWDLWSPDGSRLVGYRGRSALLGERPVDGTGGIQVIGHLPGDITSLQDVSPDGRQVLAMASTGGILALGLEGPERDRDPKPVVQVAGQYVRGTHFSPDGRWIVYSADSGSSPDQGIYVQPYPGPGLRKQIASESGFPVWRKDGKEIVIADNRGVWSVRVEAVGGGLHFSAPELLFSGLRSPVGYDASARPLAVSRDGSRIYFVQAVEQPDSNVINILTGWAGK